MLPFLEHFRALKVARHQSDTDLKRANYQNPFLSLSIVID
jgi:hypothetical protein